MTGLSEALQERVPYQALLHSNFTSVQHAGTHSFFQQFLSAFPSRSWHFLPACTVLVSCIKPTKTMLSAAFLFRAILGSHP